MIIKRKIRFGHFQEILLRHHENKINGEYSSRSTKNIHEIICIIKNVKINDKSNNLLVAL